MVRCTYHANGTFCSHECFSCDRRISTRVDRLTADRIAGDTRSHRATDRLMRQARTR